MGHEITEDDRVISTRQPTWTGLENVLDDYPTREQAEKLVHDWDVIREPLYRRQTRIVDYGLPGDYQPQLEEYYELVPEFELNVRSDTATDLAVVPTDRQDVQPKECWDLAELIQGEDKNVLIETAGSYNEGRHIWILLKLNEPVTINGDKNGLSLPLFCLQNGYVQGAGLRGQATNVRVVCANTSRLSDMVADAHGTNFSFAHTGNLAERVEGIRDALAQWRESVQQWKLAKEFMLDQPVSVDGVKWFVDQFIPEPHTKLTSDRVKDNVRVARIELITELYNGMNEGITKTSLGLFEAASSWNEHIRAAQSPQSRFKRAMLEPSTVLEDARELALQAATI